MPVSTRKTGPLNARKLIAAAGIAGALFSVSACSASEAAAPAGTAAPSASASAAATPSATPSPTAAFPYTLSSGLIAKGIANDGHGDYIQTSIADTDPAMQYNPAITDDTAKAHYSAAELADAQKFIVRFIAEEAIDSTLNYGTDVDGWMAAHKDEIHPANRDLMVSDLKSGQRDKGIDIARELWMADKPGLAYVHGSDMPRVTQRTITPVKLRYVTSEQLQGVMLDTTARYEMAVIRNGVKTVQPTTAELSYAVAKDPADGKWKIAGYNAHFHTAG